MPSRKEKIFVYNDRRGWLLNYEHHNYPKPLKRNQQKATVKGKLKVRTQTIQLLKIPPPSTDCQNRWKL